MITVEQAVIRAEIKALGAVEITRGRFNHYVCPSLDWLKRFGKFCQKENPADISKGELANCNAAAWWMVDQARVSAQQNKECYAKGYAVHFVMVAIPLCLGESEDTFALNQIPGPRNHSTGMVRADDSQWYFFEPQNGLATPAKFITGADGVGIDLFIT